MEGSISCDIALEKAISIEKQSVKMETFPPRSLLSPLRDVPIIPIDGHGGSSAFQITTFRREYARHAGKGTEDD